MTTGMTGITRDDSDDSDDLDTSRYGPVSYGSLISSLSLVTVSEVFAKVNPAQVSFSFLNWRKA